MLTSTVKTAAKTILLALGAVFFASTSSLAGDGPLFSLESGLNDLVYRLARSVVTVESSSRVQTSSITGVGDEAVRSLISSGVIYDTLGHILVEASSVVGHEHIIVRFENYILPAHAVGVDYQTGLALLSAGRRIGSPVQLADQYGCAGRMVIAVGNAYGLRSSPSIGFCAGSRPDGSVQFSVPITSGTIGGGLFDLNGRLVGIITGGIGEGQAAQAGLAVPAHAIPGIVNYLMTSGDRRAGWIGITTVEIEITPGIDITTPFSMVSETPDSDETIGRALLVTDVVPGSPAEQGGLRKGDLIYRVGRRGIASAVELMQMVRQSPPGQVIEMSFIRRNIPVETRLRIGERDLAFSSGTSNDFEDVAQKSIPADSLLWEIQRLKQVIGDLEARFKSAR